MTVALALTAAGATGQGTAAPVGRSDTCRGNDYSLQLRLWPVRGQILAGVGILTGRAPACTLETTLRVTISSRDRASARAVRGNPSVWKVARQLEPWSALVHTWLWRNWCRSSRGLTVTASANGSHVVLRVTAAPTCNDKRRASRLVDAGTGTRLIPFTIKGIPAQLLPPDAPEPLSPALIRVTNAWLVSDGRTLVAVYAGEAGEDAAVGRFAIIRQNLVFGEQTEDSVDVGRVGATTISEAPTGVAVETSAQRADLGFTSASGTKGILRLADDTTQLQP